MRVRFFKRSVFAPRGLTQISRIVPLLLWVALTGSGCESHCGPVKPPRAALRVSMIPTTDPSRALRESEPFVTYLEQTTGTQVSLTVPTNYAAVVEALVNDQVDFAYLGGFTYVQAATRAGVQPLVQRERDRAFHSLIIAHNGSGIRTLLDLNSHSFAFGDVNSTSGHLMPAYYMRRSGVSPNVLGRAIYTGGHDATALAVANGKVDAGALDELIFERMITRGMITTDQVAVIYKTPAFFDYVWVTRKGLDEALRTALRDAFLHLDKTRSADQQILDLLGATKYLAASDADYVALRQAARDEGLLK
jgi:phosphonate transport system substrate-binding protein